MGADHDEWLDGDAFFGSDSGSGSGGAPEPGPEPKPPHPHHVPWAIVAAVCCAALLICGWLFRRTCGAKPQREAALQTEYDVPQPAAYLSGSLQHDVHVFSGENRGRPSSLNAPLVKSTAKQTLDDVTGVGW